MALVLCTGTDLALLRSRQLLLERAGHSVISVLDEKELQTVCQQHRFDVAILAQGLSAKVKQRVTKLVRTHCPNVKVLELYLVSEGQLLEDADSWLQVPTVQAQELSERVNELAGDEKKDNLATGWA